MEKVMNIVLFALAVFAGGVLFVFGKRYIQKTSQSRYVSRFFVYISIVLVFLSGAFGITRFGARVAFAEEKDAAQKQEKKNLNLVKNGTWRKIAMFWHRIRRQRTSARNISPESATKLQAEKELMINSLDGLKKDGTISGAMRAHVTFELGNEFYKVLLASEGKKITDQEAAARFVKGLQLQNALLQELREDKNFNRTLAWRLRQTLADTFQGVKGVAFAARLKDGKLTKKEYRKLVTGVLDNAFFFIKKANVVVPQRPGLKPQLMEKYGVKPQVMMRYGVRPSVKKYGVRPMPKYGVRPVPRPVDVAVTTGAVEGAVSLRQAGGVWAVLEKGTSLYLTTVLVNKKNDAEAKITLSNGKVLILGKDAIITGWELSQDYPCSIQNNLR